MTNLIFLDFDGVLNSWESDALRRHPSQIDEVAVARLNRLVYEASAEVVISSTWRLSHPRATLYRMLRERGFEGCVIGRTPDLNMIAGARGHEIQAWLDSNDRTADKIVILDDVEQMAHLHHRLVRTNIAVGLTDADVDRALTMLRS